LGAALRTGEPLETEARLWHTDGDYRWALMCLAPLRDEKGNIVKWYGTKTDIEDRSLTQALPAGENAFSK
jgi:PAS domain-containing protein